MSRADWRNGYRNGANYLLGTNSKGIHSRPLVSIESCYSVNSKGKSLCAGLHCSVVERVQVSKWSPSRPCYVLSVIQYLCRKVGKLCRDNFNEKQINKSEEIGFRVRRDTEFRTRLRCKDLYRFLCQILSHGIKSSSETLIYLRSATFSSFISIYICAELLNKWTFEKRNTLESICQYVVHIYVNQGGRERRGLFRIFHQIRSSFSRKL